MAWEATATLLLPWLRYAGSAAPLLLTHAGVLRLGLVQGGSGHHLGDGYEKAKCHSPATAASSVPEGCPPCCLKSLEDKHQRHRSEFFLYQSESSYSSPPRPGSWLARVSWEQHRVPTTLGKLQVSRKGRDAEKKRIIPHRSWHHNLVSQPLTHWEKYQGKNSSSSPYIYDQQHPLPSTVWIPSSPLEVNTRLFSSCTFESVSSLAITPRHTSDSTKERVGNY